MKIRKLNTLFACQRLWESLIMLLWAEHEIPYEKLIFKFPTISISSPVGWGFRLHRLHLCRVARTRPPTSVMIMPLNDLMVRLQLWRFGESRVTPHYHCSQVHSGPLVVAPDMVLSLGQIAQTVCKQMTDVKL